MSTIENIRPYSLYLSRLLDNSILHQEYLEEIIQYPLTMDFFQQYASWDLYLAQRDEVNLKQSLRQLRQIVIAHIMARDLAQLSHLQEVTQTITIFADFVVIQATEFAHAYYEDLYGSAIGQYSREVQKLSVVAMGKMGGYELNVSSDIDLIFVYPEQGETNGKRERSNQEFFTKVGQKLITILNDATEYGQVFRVDMRLRPDGDSGALVLSETALEQYLITQGREWERYAWIKARVVTPYANDILNIVRPFIYRKYFDFSAFAALRGLHKQIRQEVLKKNLEDNIKLGLGGIREIEFIAQIYQLIRGGQVKDLQIKGTQEVLKKLVELQLLSEQESIELLSAYIFLRNVEHRLQYWDDQQTQILPQNTVQQNLLAQSMAYQTYSDFLMALNEHRSQVNQIFNALLKEQEIENEEDVDKLSCVWNGSDDVEQQINILIEFGYQEPMTILNRLQEIKNSSKYRLLRPEVQKRFDELIPQAIEVASHFQLREQTLARLFDFFVNIARRSVYLSLLHEQPNILNKVAKIMSLSEWMTKYLMQHPILLDELLSDQLLNTQTDWDKEKQNLQYQLTTCGNDIEAQMDVLRHFQHSYVFHLGIQDIEGLWTVEALSDELSILTDLILSVSIQQVWKNFNKKHQDKLNFIIVSYGKLGGKELGFSSDLDLVYLYQDDDADANNIYSRFANRLTSFLSVSTGAGVLYEIDLRLRPNGNSGFVAQSLDMFKRYQYESAWPWEYQALTRARFVCGDELIGQQFEIIRQDILQQERDKVILRQDVIKMREKMFLTHPPLDEDIKYARGGVVDVEFIVQYLVLAFANQYPDLTKNLGNIALLKMSAQYGLINEELADRVRIAYRNYRQIQHKIDLYGLSTFLVDADLSKMYADVRLLWEQVFQQKIL